MKYYLQQATGQILQIWQSSWDYIHQMISFQWKLEIESHQYSSKALRDNIM